MGQKTKYKAEYAKQAEKLCLLGAIDKDIADFFGVGTTSIDRWKKAHKEFKKALTKGKAPANANVKRSLYKRAIGYEHPEDKIFCNSDGDVTKVKTTKRYPPDTAAAFIWLKNRDPANWRDVQTFEGELTINIKEKFNRGNKS